MGKKEVADYQADNGAQSATSPDLAPTAPTMGAFQQGVPSPANDLQTRATAFNDEMKALLAKYEFALMAEPRFVPNADGQWTVIADPKVIDARPKTDIVTP